MKNYKSYTVVIVVLAISYILATTFHLNRLNSKLDQFTEIVKAAEKKNKDIELLNRYKKRFDVEINYLKDKDKELEKNMFILARDIKREVSVQKNKVLSSLNIPIQNIDEVGVKDIFHRSEDKSSINKAPFLKRK